MKNEKNSSNRVLITLLKEPFLIHTITFIADALDITRQGLWKIIKKLGNEDLIKLETVGNTKKSAVIIELNWKSPLIEKVLSLQLIQDALKEERWRDNFAEFEPHVKFLILFGSVLNNTKEANDIDILAIVKNKNSFKAIEKSLFKVQKTQIKKIHFIDLTEKELFYELKKQNKSYMDALKKGVVLFGADNYIKFIKSLKNEK